MTSRWVFQDAAKCGLAPRFDVKLIWAPRRSRAAAAFTCPFWQARPSGRKPRVVALSTRAPSPTSASMTLTWPSDAALHSGVKFPFDGR